MTLFKFIKFIEMDWPFLLKLIIRDKYINFLPAKGIVGWFEADALGHMQIPKT